MKHVYLEFKQGKSLTCIKFLFTVDNLPVYWTMYQLHNNEFHTFKLLKIYTYMFKAVPEEPEEIFLY